MVSATEAHIKHNIRDINKTKGTNKKYTYVKIYVQRPTTEPPAASAGGTLIVKSTNLRLRALVLSNVAIPLVKEAKLVLVKHHSSVVLLHFAGRTLLERVK